MILYGSYARGDFNQWSDIDAIIISDAFRDTRPLDRWNILADTNPPPGLEPIPWTPSEAEKMLKKPSWRKALSQGCVAITDDYNITPQTCKTLETLIQELKKREERIKTTRYRR